MTLSVPGFVHSGQIQDCLDNGRENKLTLRFANKRRQISMKEFVGGVEKTLRDVTLPRLLVFFVSGPEEI